MFDARNNINSLFGLYTVDVDNGNITWVNDNNTNAKVYDYVLRDNGKKSIQASIRNSDKVLKAIQSPVDFLTAKTGDLVTIANSLSKKYPKILQRYLNRNLPIGEARKKALEDLDKKFDNKMKKHNEEYPKELVGKLVRKLTG